MIRLIARNAIVATIAFLFCLSCVKAPFISITSPRSYTLNCEGGTQVISFSCNRNWTISPSENWLRISRTSGAASDEEIVVNITCDANMTYEPRSAKIAIMVDELTETITINQETNLGLIVSPLTIDLSEEAQSIEVEVRHNVDYSVEIDSASRDWIIENKTKGLSSNKICFSIAANDSFDNREGIITIRQIGGNLYETISIRQLAKAYLKIDKTDFTISAIGGSIEIIVQTNKAIEIISTNTWIHYVETKTISQNTFYLSVDSNDSNVREGIITIKHKEGNLSEEVRIQQKEIPSGAVNMGLSVFWAECNLGASSREEYGDFFAWGETETKEYYDWSNYKWCNGSYSNLTKYNSNPDSGVVDNKDVLDESDDVVRVKLGGSWRMPTPSEVAELDNTRSSEDYEWKRTGINGHRGWMITYLKNGNTLFFPASGNMNQSTLYNTDSYTLLWTSVRHPGDMGSAFTLEHNSSNTNYYGGSYTPRQIGLPVRPVSD